MPVDLATLSSWLKSEEINVDLESKLLLREAVVMEPATALTASQNYRGGRGGGRQGSRGGYGRNSRGRGRGGRQGSRPPYDGQQHGSNNSLHFFGSCGQLSSKRDRPTCQICQKTGHTAVHYWFRYEESRNSDNRANYASQADPSSEWLLDTGANMHVTSDLSKLNAPNPYHGSNGITVGNGESLNIAHSY